MSDVSGQGAAASEAPSRLGGKLRFAGPGLVLAVTGFGAADTVASVVAGERFATTFIWAIVIGAVIKYFLTEGVGRWYLATGQTILQGWHSIGAWASGYFLIYLLLVTFVFGAAVTSAAGLAFNSMVGGLPVPAWAAIHGVLGFLIVGVGRYKLFERLMEVFVALLFVTVVGLAVLLAPGLGDLAVGLVPRVPDGSLLYALGVVGSVGGTFTLASYGYWARERGWRGAAWIPIMRADLVLSYVLIAVFVVAMLVIGSEVLYGSGRSIQGEEGLLALSNPIGDQFGGVARWMLLLGFWAAAMSSILGAWNGAAHLFADTVRNFAGNERDPEHYLSERSPFFRGFLAWITFPPMLLYFFDQPVFLVVIYAALGALFLPFLALTLLWLLNSCRVEPQYRNRVFSNVAMASAVLLFAVLLIQEIAGLF